MRSDLVHDTRKVCVFVVDPVILMPNPSLCDPVGPMRIVHETRVRSLMPRWLVRTSLLLGRMFGSSYGLFIARLPPYHKGA